MSVLETSPSFVARKRNIGACAPPWGRWRQELPCRNSFAKALPGPFGLSAAERRQSAPEIPICETRNRGYDLAYYPRHGGYIHFLKAPPGAACQIKPVNRTGTDPGIPRTLLHTTTGNRLKLLTTENVALKLSSRKNGYWRARAVADVRGSPNARFRCRRLTFTDSSTCTSGHSNHGPPGCIDQQLPITGIIQIP